jgi:hypothetical protein
MGGTFFDDVLGMIDKNKAMKDGGGGLRAKIDDGVRVAQWIR